jgi:hypothetical protein
MIERAIEHTFTQAERDLRPVIVRAGDPAIVQRNLDVFQQHALAEQVLDLETTMATIHRDQPFQIFRSSGCEVWGWENVREFYRQRMTVFSGQALFAQSMFIGETEGVVRGWFKGAPNGYFFGHATTGKPLFFPATVWLYFKDGLLLGETSYFNGALVDRQAAEGATGDVCAPLY